MDKILISSHGNRSIHTPARIKNERDGAGCRFQRRCAYVEYGSVAVSASGREQVVVVRFAVRPSFALEKIARAQLLGTVVAREVFRVPSLAQRRDHLPDDSLVARRATSLLCRVHPLSVHLGR